MATAKIVLERISNKTILKFGLISSFVIIFFQVANHLVIYNYLKLDFYLSFVAVAFLAAGLLIRGKEEIVKEIPVEIIREVEIIKEISPALDSADNVLSKLTQKELQILKLIIRGKSNKEIAEINFVEVSTIKTHLNNLYTKLSVKNRREASIKYSETVQNHSDI